jgi:small-conductance mechanosensitive channel
MSSCRPHDFDLSSTYINIVVTSAFLAVALAFFRIVQWRKYVQTRDAAHLHLLRNVLLVVSALKLTLAILMFYIIGQQSPGCNLISATYSWFVVAIAALWYFRAQTIGKVIRAGGSRGRMGADQAGAYNGGFVAQNPDVEAGNGGYRPPVAVEVANDADKVEGVG